MSVANIIPIARYRGDGETKIFPVPFQFLDERDVYVKSSTKGSVSAADYSIEGQNITFSSAPQDGEIIAVLRNTAIERIADYDETGAVSGASLNDNLDRPLLSMQEIAEVLDRCVKVDPTSYVDPQEYLEQNVKIAENSKDVALNAAVSAANSAQTAATSERNIGLIWAEITGDPTLAENALITLKEAAEATGAITAAKELAIGEVRNTGAIAVAATEKAADEAREAAEAASNAAGSISKTVADEITIQVSQAAGATGVLGVAIEAGKKVVEEARQEAFDRAEEVLNNINSGNTSFNENKNAALIEIQGKVDAVAIDVEKAVEKAQLIANNYLKDAKATVSGSLTDLEQMKQDASVAGDTELVKLIDKRIQELQDLQKNLTDAETAAENALEYSNSANIASGNASSSASSAAIKAAEALESAQDAATSASEAAASAVAASTTATEVSNQLLTVHNASAEAHPAFDNKYLPRAGGAMSGPIYKNTDDDSLRLFGGTTPDKGAELNIFGVADPDLPGCIQLVARAADGTPKTLNLYPDGTLTWDDKYVLNNSFLMSVDTSAIMLTAGTSNTGGAYFRLYGKDHTDGAGQFVLATTDGTNTNALVGKPDGTLNWNGKYVLNNSFQMPSDSGVIAINSGTSATGGAYFLLYGKDHTDWAGQFFLATTDGTNTNALVGKPDGTLTWGGNVVECGNVVGYSYMRYASGLQTCWGASAVSSYTTTYVNFPLSFSHGVHGFVTPTVSTSDALGCSASTTYIAINSGSFAGTVYWLAIGRWK